MYAAIPDDKKMQNKTIQLDFVNHATVDKQIQYMRWRERLSSDVSTKLIFHSCNNSFWKWDKKKVL